MVPAKGPCWFLPEENGFYDSVEETLEEDVRRKRKRVTGGKESRWCGD